MNDLISRQAAIDALHTWFKDGFEEDKWWNSTHVLAAIEGLPSADIQDELDNSYQHGWTAAEAKYRKILDEMPNWIPCSERMPEKNTLILASYSEDGDVTMAFYDGGDDWTFDAWMNVPEPWEGSK